MNYPGRPSGNWQWRFTTGEVTPELVAAAGRDVGAVLQTPGLGSGAEVSLD